MCRKAGRLPLPPFILQYFRFTINTPTQSCRRTNSVTACKYCLYCFLWHLYLQLHQGRPFGLSFSPRLRTYFAGKGLRRRRRHAWQRDYKGHHALCFRQRQKLARHPPHLPFGTCHAGLSRTRRPETGGMGQRPARQPDTARTAAGRPLGDGLRVAHPPTPNSDNLPRSRLARRPLLRHHRYTDLRRCALRHRHPLRQGTSPAAQGLRRSRYGAPPQGVRGKLRRRFPLHPAQDGQHARLLRPAQRHRCELPPEASFNDRGDFVSSVFNILPTEEELRIDIYHRGVLQTTVISDSNGKPLRVSEGRLLNVLVDFDGAISVEVKVTDWGKQEIWKEF